MSAGITLAGLATGLTIASGVNALTGGAITKGLGFGPKDTPASAGTPSSAAMPSSAGGNIDPGVQAAADPFSPYRADFAKQYAAAMAPGAKTDPTQLAGYSQFQSGVLDPALQASERAAAATGRLTSGAEAASLAKISTQGYSGFMTDYLNRLATGSGATSSPAGGAQMGYTAAQAQQQGVSEGFGALATTLKGLGGMFKGSGAQPGSGDRINVGGADTYGQGEYGTGTGYDWSSYDPYANLSQEQIMYY
jgi:hypothetical protein